MSILLPKRRYPFSSAYVTTTAARDISGNVDNGVITGGPLTAVAGPSGAAGGGMGFLGTQVVLNQSILNWATWTLSGWINIAAYGAGRMVPFSFDDLGVLTDKIIYINNNGIVQALSGSLVTNALGSAVALNTWTLLTVTYDGTTLNVYQNNHLDGTASGAGGAGNAGTYVRPAFRIGGASRDWAQSDWVGSIADVRGDDSVATTQEIASLVAGLGVASGVQNYFFGIQP